MNLNAHLHLAQQRPEQLRQEAQRDRLARQALAAHAQAPQRPRFDLHALLVRLHLA